MLWPLSDFMLGALSFWPIVVTWWWAGVFIVLIILLGSSILKRFIKSNSKGFWYVGFVIIFTTFVLSRDLIMALIFIVLIILTSGLPFQNCEKLLEYYPKKQVEIDFDILKKEILDWGVANKFRLKETKFDNAECGNAEMAGSFLEGAREEIKYESDLATKEIKDLWLKKTVLNEWQCLDNDCISVYKKVNNRRYQLSYDLYDNHDPYFFYIVIKHDF